jgi:hypothetical protein
MKNVPLLVLWFVALVFVPCVARADFNSYRTLDARQVSAIMSTNHREVINLSGGWHEGGSQNAIQLPASMPSRSPVTLKRIVKIESQNLQQHYWHLYLFGVRDEFELKVNGRFINRFPGGLVPFMVKIPDRSLVPGTNTIELTVNPPSELSNNTQQASRWAPSTYVGVVREVFLVGMPHVWSSDVRIRSILTGGNTSATLAGVVQINAGNVERLAGNAGNALQNGKVGITVYATIATSDGVVVARTTPSLMTMQRERQAEYRFSADIANPRLWSPSSPNLYSVVVTVEHNGVVIDKYESNVGVRTAAIVSTDKGRRFSLNDSVIAVNAIDYYEGYPTVGQTISAAQMAQDVQMMKTLGVNAVVVRGGSLHPYFVYLCDTYGLMVFCDIDLYDVPSTMLVQDEIRARSINMAERLGSFVYSHPCVVACGVSSGLDEESEHVASFFATLPSLLRTRSSKLVYKTVPATKVEHASEGGFDIVMIRFYTAPSATTIPEVLQAASRSIRSAGIITVFGSLVSPDNRNGFADALSNEAQAVVVRDAYRASMAAGIAGCCVWSFADYTLAQPTMLVEHHDAYVCTSGLVDIWRQPRVSYTMLKSLINDEKEPLLQARETPFQTPLIFIAWGLILALGLTFLINRSRRFREYLMRAIVRPYNFYADIRDQRILSTVQTVLLGSLIAACAGLLLASWAYYIRVDADMEYLIRLIIPNATTLEVLRFVAWKPALAVLLCSALVMFVMFGVASLLRVGAMFVKGRIVLRDTLTIVVWSCLPLVVLLPIAVALYAVLSTTSVSFWIPLVIVACAIWSFIRTLKSTSVVFDVPSTIVYGIGFGTLALTLAVYVVVWNSWYHLFEYVRYYASVVQG